MTFNNDSRIYRVEFQRASGYMESIRYVAERKMSKAELTAAICSYYEIEGKVTKITSSEVVR